ncbi:hypothetical protein JCGZ_07088 [Jatropha curcas]|uniref:Protein POLAR LOCALIZATION DURING ASYMMETRIC DIVISION AND REDISTRIBUTION-like n=1 Tax=Jatropha curcas TaxID=180498 RepID=A0A067KBK4_JATCU|nr:protein POLAR LOCALIZATION DURING ASYMMETRIC DIVISION AND REDISTRIBUTION [Jatropha curcas]KDP33517.1 hypothetical protein JCGZ_07088 [Jatropha curcas]
MKPVFNYKLSNAPLSSSSSQDRTRPPLRIADILLAGDDDDLDENSLMDGSSEILRSITCYSPRRIVARWLSSLRRARVKRIAEESVKREKESKREEEEKGLGDVTVQARCSMNGFNGGGLESPATDSGQSRIDASFNMGVGCCLLYLVAASKTELHRMIEMRMQMENLLQNTREELLKQNELFKQSEPNDVFAYLDTDAGEGGDCETQILAESSTFTVCDQSLKWETPEKEECLEQGRNRLEAELEVELQRLQLRLDTEKLMKDTEQLRIKEWERASDEHTASSKSQAMSSGEVIDPQLQDSSTDCGVPPNELERRLHELLEERQQEEIRELEAALECLKQELYEKEMEVSWWKDTAMLISHHAMEPSQSTSLGELQMYDSFSE